MARDKLYHSASHPRDFPEGQILTNAMEMAKVQLKLKIKPGDLVADATAGNGYDSLFLADLVGNSGHVYSFDIQDTAIEATRTLLSRYGLLERVTLVLSGHENLDQYCTAPLRAVVFNLGYLPGGDRTKTTQFETTKTAIEKSLSLLTEDGMIVLVVYSGHSTGNLEASDLRVWLTDLPQKQYSVMEWKFINQKNSPPSLILIEKNQKPGFKP